MRAVRKAAVAVAALVAGTALLVSPATAMVEPITGTPPAPSSYSGTISTSAGLDVRFEAKTASRWPGPQTIPYGVRVYFDCQVASDSYGGSTLWDHLLAPYNGWLPDAYVSTGHTTQWAPTCGRKGPTPYRGTISASSGLDLRYAARTAARYSPVTTIAYGAAVYFDCQVAGESYGGSSLWDHVVAPYTGWLPDAYVSTGHTSQWAGTCGSAGPKSTTSTVVTHALPAYTEVQQEATWCGPAALRAMLRMLGASPPTQAILAGDSSTGWAGTNPNAMADELNREQSSYTYGAYGIDTNADLWSFVTGRINARHPVALLVASERWTGGKSLEAHWIVVYGYRTDSATGAATYLISDPADGQLRQLERSEWTEVQYGLPSWVQWIVGGPVVG